MMTQDEVLQFLRTELPRMLQEDPIFRAQVIGVLTEVLASKEEVERLLQELRAMRADFERRFDSVTSSAPKSNLPGLRSGPSALSFRPPTAEPMHLAP